MRGRRVFVAGAGNSAGQAAIYLAKYAQQVTILVRGDALAPSMSDYLIKQIDGTPNIAVRSKHTGGDSSWLRATGGARSAQRGGSDRNRTSGWPVRVDRGRSAYRLVGKDACARCAWLHPDRARFAWRRREAACWVAAGSTALPPRDQSAWGLCCRRRAERFDETRGLGGRGRGDSHLAHSPLSRLVSGAGAASVHLAPGPLEPARLSRLQGHGARQGIRCKRKSLNTKGKAIHHEREVRPRDQLHGRSGPRAGWAGRFPHESQKCAGRRALQAALQRSR